MRARTKRWCLLCANDSHLTVGAAAPHGGRLVRFQTVGPFSRIYWVGMPDTGSKIHPNVTVTLPVGAHKDDVPTGTAGWTCEVYQQERFSDKHQGRSRLPNHGAGLSGLLAEGGDQLRSQTGATMDAAHEVASDALVRPGSFDTSSGLLTRHPHLFHVIQYWGPI
jgi:hypothetical protein